MKSEIVKFILIILNVYLMLLYVESKTCLNKRYAKIQKYFDLVTHDSLHACLEECLTRQRCNSVTHITDKICLLMDKEVPYSTGQLDRKENESVVFNKREINKHLTLFRDWCQPTFCKENERCWTCINEIVCVPFECIPPIVYPGLQLKEKAISRMFATYVTYQCISDNAITQTSKCLNSGMWSNVSNSVCPQRGKNTVCKSCESSTNDSSKHNKLCYTYYDILLNQSEAVSYCRNCGGGLPSIKHEHQLSLLESLMRNGNHTNQKFLRMWVDGRRSHGHGWRLSDGSKITVKISGTDFGNCLVLTLRNSHSSYLDRKRCNDKYEFLCEQNVGNG